MMENLESLVEAALAEVAGAGDARALDDVRVRYLGKKGEISALRCVGFESVKVNTRKPQRPFAIR